MVVSGGFSAACFCFCLLRQQLDATSTAVRFWSLSHGSTQAARLTGQPSHSMTSEPCPKKA